MQKISIKSWEEAADLLASVRDWKNANGQLVECQEKIEHLEKLSKRNKKIAVFAMISCVAIAVVTAIATVAFSVYVTVIPPLNKYNEMLSLIEANKLKEAYVLCQELGDYKDCASIKEDIGEKVPAEAENLYFSGDARGAAQLLSDWNMPDPGYYEVSIGDYKTAINKGLTNIVIPNGVTSIGDEAFSHCGRLVKVTIPNSVTSIGVYAFYRCSSLTDVNFQNPNGWRISTSATFEASHDVSSSNLSDASTAANHLTQAYYDYYWACD